LKLDTAKKKRNWKRATTRRLHVQQIVLLHQLRGTAMRKKRNGKKGRTTKRRIRLQ
jgi:hypothetical protein